MKVRASYGKTRIPPGDKNRFQQLLRLVHEKRLIRGVLEELEAASVLEYFGTLLIQRIFSATSFVPPPRAPAAARAQCVRARESVEPAPKISNPHRGRIWRHREASPDGLCSPLLLHPARGHVFPVSPSSSNMKCTPRSLDTEHPE